MSSDNCRSFYRISDAYSTSLSSRLSSNPSHSFKYPSHLSLSSYYCPIQVTPSYTPFTFPLFFDPIHLLFVLRRLLVSFSSARTRGELAFHHLRIPIYSQLHTQPISLSLPRTSPIRAPRFTCSSSLYSVISAPDSTHLRTAVYTLQSITSRLFVHADTSPRTERHSQRRSLEAQ